MEDYQTLATKLPQDQWFTAKQVGMVAATLTAMAKRGLVEVNKAISPRQYRVSCDNATIAVFKAVKWVAAENDGLVLVQYSNRDKGEYLLYKNDTLYHNDGKTALVAEEIRNITEVYYYEQGKKVAVEV